MTNGKQPTSYWVITVLFWAMVLLFGWLIIDAIVDKDVLDGIAITVVALIIWFGSKGESIFMRRPPANRN